MLQKELGRGGMGAVYAAVNTWTGRTVAIKTLRAEVARSRQLLDRFWQEGRAASKLHHPNVIDVLDMGWDEGTGEPFLVQEFLEGESLEQRIKRSPGGRLPPAEALALLLPIAGALLACHRAGILHRDVKPANIVVTPAPDGAACPKLIDFGISKDLVPDPDAASHTATGAPLGSPAYMSPEQARGDRAIDARTDIWALGATLFEAITGARPYAGATVALVLAKVIYEPPPRVADVDPSVPADLAAAIDAALQHDRDHRLPTMEALAAALLNCEAARGEAVRTTHGFARLVADVFNESASGERVRAMVAGAPPAAPAPIASTHDVWSQGTAPPPRAVSRRHVAVGLGFVGLFGLSAAIVALRGPHAPEPVGGGAPVIDVVPLVPAADASSILSDAVAVVDVAPPDARAIRVTTPRRVDRPTTPQVPRQTRHPRDPLAPDDEPYEASQ